MRPQHLLDMVEHQAKQGVDYMTDPLPACCSSTCT